MSPSQAQVGLQHVSVNALPNTPGLSMQGVIPSTQHLQVVHAASSEAGETAQGSNVEDEDPQTYYPATACVFVAK